MLAVRWGQLKVGPTLRRERDARLYLSLFRQHPAYVSGLERRAALRGPRSVEPKDLDVAVSPDRLTVVTFGGLGRFFEQLAASDAFLTDQLLAVVRRSRLPSASEMVPLVAHVRLGDFGNAVTPMPWFVRRVEELRRAGIDAPIGVVSDGAERELQPLLDLRGVTLVRTGSAIGDLLVAACSQALIGSSHSTFSAWAAFLGRQPVTFLDGGDMVGLEDLFPSRIAASTEADGHQFVDRVRSALNDSSELRTLVIRRKDGGP